MFTVYILDVFFSSFFHSFLVSSFIRHFHTTLLICIQPGKRHLHIPIPFKKKEADVSGYDLRMKEENEILKQEVENLKKKYTEEIEELGRKYSDAKTQLEDEKMKNEQLLLRYIKTFHILCRDTY